MRIKVAVPFLVLGLAVYGCGDSGGGGRAGGGGAGGRAGGAGGTAGGTGGTAGGAGGTAGGAGGTAGGAGGTAGGAGGTAGGAGGTAGGGGTGGAATLAELKNTCATSPPFMSMDAAGVFTAADFCTLYNGICMGTDAATGYMTREMCLATYGALSADKLHCRSYHICNASNSSTATAITTHCGHASGMAPCTP